MKHSIWAIVVVATCTLGTGVGQVASPDGLAILQQVSQRYADAKSYHIEATEERTSSQEMGRTWSKTVLSAAEASDNRYFFSSKASAGSSLVVSDGKTEWAYEAEAHFCTQKPIPSSGPTKPEDAMPFSPGARRSQELRSSLASLAKGYKPATRLPDEIVLLEGREIPSLVVRVSTADLKHESSTDATLEATYWIDKASLTIVKEIDREHTFMKFFNDRQIPVYEETITTYPVTDLDLQHTNPSLFSFMPPRDAKLVDKFPDPFKPPDLTGKAAPLLSLKTSDGKEVSLDSFRGKSVLIDFWATWCAPCVESMPKLADIYQRTKDMGLVFLTIDLDGDAKDATDFLTKHHYVWPNFHGNHDMGNGFGEHFGIPRTILVDATGKIVFDGSGEHDDELVAAVIKLGPE